MSRCSSKKSTYMLLESKTRQVMYTILVASCSLTIGMCLEWTLCNTDVAKADNANVYYLNKYKSLLLKNFLYFGAIVGAGPAAFVASILGLRETLTIGVVITTVGSVALINITGTLRMLFIGRIIQGLGAGVVFVIVPNYAMEIADPKIRGVLSGFHYVSLLIGMLLSHVGSMYYTSSFVNMGILAMTFVNLIALLVVSDPPYYQLKLEKRTSVFDFELKIEDFKPSMMCSPINTNLKNHDNLDTMDLNSVFKEKIFWKPLLMNVCLICTQQLSGLYLITSKLLSAYGILIISDILPAMPAVISLQLITSILCLIIIAPVGKRYLLIVSGFGMAITLSLMNVAYDKEIIDHDEIWLLFLIVIYMIFYSIGYGPVPWMLMPEICPRKTRLWTSGVTVSLYAFMNITTNQLFYENINLVYGVDIFLLVFTITSVVGAFIAYQYVPEENSILT